MAGTREGGIQARNTNLEKYGADYYKQIGRKGGAAIPTKPRGFAYMAVNDPERLANIGKRGGGISRRGKAKKR